MSNISIVGTASVPSQTVLNNLTLRSGLRIGAKMSLATIGTFLILAGIVFIRECYKLKNPTLSPEQLYRNHPLSDRELTTWLSRAEQHLWIRQAPVSNQSSQQIIDMWDARWVDDRNGFSLHGIIPTINGNVDRSQQVYDDIQNRLNSPEFQANPQRYFDSWERPNDQMSDTHIVEIYSHDFFREHLGFSRSTASQEAIDDQRLSRTGGVGSIGARIRILARNYMGAFNGQTQLRPTVPTIR